MENNGELWVFIEHKEGKIQECSFRLVCEGRTLANKLGKELSAIIIGLGVQNFAEALGPYGIAKAYIVENKLLERFNGDAYAQIISDLTRKYNPAMILFGATLNSNELAARIAAALNVSLLANCIEFDLNEKGQIIGRKPAYGGNVHATVTPTSQKNLVATVDLRGLDMEKVADPKQPQIIIEEMKLSPEMIKTAFIDYKKANPRTIGLTEAERIIAVGRGVEKVENMKIVEDLADAIGATIGGSRPAVDAGWVGHDRKIGSSGVDISPTLDVVLGVSGAGHFLSGVRGSKFTVVVNKDRSAPIFKIADIGVVGDIKQVVPALTKQLRALKEKAPKN